MSVDKIIEQINNRLEYARLFFEIYIDIKEDKAVVDYELETMEDLYEAFPELSSLAFIFNISANASSISYEQKRLEAADLALSNNIDSLKYQIEENKKQIETYEMKGSKSRGRKQINRNKPSYKDLIQGKKEKIEEFEDKIVEAKKQKQEVQEEFLAIPEKVEILGNYVSKFLSLKKDISETLENSITDYCVNLSKELGFDIEKNLEASSMDIPEYASQKVYDFLKSNFENNEIIQNIKPKKTKKITKKPVKKKIIKKKAPEKESSIMNSAVDTVGKGIKKEISLVKKMWYHHFGKFCLIIGVIGSFLAGGYFGMKNEYSNKKALSNEKTIAAKEESKKTEIISKKTDPLDILIKSNETDKKKLNSAMFKIINKHEIFPIPFKVIELCQGTIYKPSRNNTFVVQGGEAYQVQGYDTWEKRLNIIKLQGGKIESHFIMLPGPFLDNVPDFYFSSKKNPGFKQAIDIERNYGKVRLLQPDGSGYRLNIAFNQDLYHELNNIDDFSFYCVLDGEKKDARDLFEFSKVYRDEPPKKLEFVVEIEKKDYKFTLPFKLDNVDKKVD